MFRQSYVANLCCQACPCYAVQLLLICHHVLHYEATTSLLSPDCQDWGIKLLTSLWCTNSDSEEKMKIVRAAHTRYCEKQQENSKTTRVLESAFGEEVAKRYIREIMFDAPQQHQAEAAVLT